MTTLIQTAPLPAVAPAALSVATPPAALFAAAPPAALFAAAPSAALFAVAPPVAAPPAAAPPAALPVTAPPAAAPPAAVPPAAAAPAAAPAAALSAAAPSAALPAAAPSAALPSAELISLDVVRSRLATIWLGGAGGVVGVVVLQSLLHRFGHATQEAWGWLLPTIMPTLGMILTVLGYSALDPVSSTSVVRRDFFRLARMLSIVYLVLVATTVLIGPFAASDGAGMIDLMHTSNMWLGPLQGLVTSALGVLFVTKQKKDGDKP